MAKKATPAVHDADAASPAEPRRLVGTRRSGATPPPAVNEPLAFINFVAAFRSGAPSRARWSPSPHMGPWSTSPLPDGGYLHCYIPLSAMGTPPPTKAREVLTKGEVRPFVLAGLDPPRRVAELALPADRRHRCRRRRQEGTAHGVLEGVGIQGGSVDVSGRRRRR